MAVPRKPIPSASIVKLTQPRLSNVLERPRLFRLLAAATKRAPILWICAPPGAGKTTLVASYLKARTLRPIWYQVDEGDADPGTLFYYLGLANRRAAPRYRQPLPRLAPENLQNLSTFTRRFLERFFARLTPPGPLVFDNYQELPDEAPTQSLLKIALQGLPDGYTVIVLSRTPPPPVLAALQVSRWLTVLEPHLLSLTVDETKQLLRLQQPKMIDRGNLLQIEHIQRRTQGWVAGVVLWAAQHESREGDGTGAQSPSEITPVVFDYLATEVLTHQSPTHQRILLYTAFFPSFTERMAEQLTDNPDVKTYLMKLARAHYFTERRPGKEAVYQYHPLFRQFLLVHATDNWSGQKVRDLQIRAAQILAEAGQVEDAVELLFAAEQYDELSQLVLAKAQTFFNEGRAQTIERWINRLPSEIVQTHPWIRFWSASGLFLRDPNASVPVFEEVFQAFQDDKDLVGALMAGCGAMQAILNSYVDFKRLDRWLDRLTPLLKSNRAKLPKEIIDRVVSSIFCAMSFRRLHDSNIIEYWATQAHSFLEDLSDPMQRVLTAYHLNMFYTQGGDFQKGAVILRQIERWLASGQIPPLGHVLYYHIAGTDCWVKGDGDATLQTVKKGKMIANQNGLEHLLGVLFSNAITGAILNKDLSLAHKLLEEARPTQENAPGQLGSSFHFHAGWIFHMEGNFDKALHHFRQSLDLNHSSGWPFIEGIIRQAMAHTLVELGEWDQTREHIKKTYEIAEACRTPTLTYYAYFAEAQLAHAQAELEQELPIIQKALVLGKAKGFVYLMGLLPPNIARACARALEVGVEVEHARLIIQQLKLIPENPVLTTEQWPWPVKIHSFGRFVLEVEERPVAFGRKAPRGPLLLLKALIAYGGANVPVTRLADTLWPDSEGDAAYASFTTTLARLRKLLKHPEALLLHEEKLSLNPQIVWVDSVMFDGLLRKAEEAEQQGQEEQAIDLRHKAVCLYQGPFLPEDVEAPWTLNRQEALRQRYAQTVSRLVDHWQANSQWEAVITCLRQARQVEPELQNGWSKPLAQALRKTGQAQEAETLETAS